MPFSAVHGWPIPGLLTPPAHGHDRATTGVYRQALKRRATRSHRLAAHARVLRRKDNGKAVELARPYLEAKYKSYRVGAR